MSLAADASISVAERSYARGCAEGNLMHTTLVEVLDRLAASRPNAPAVVDVAAGRRLSYGELAHASASAASWLTSRGVRKGDRVALWAPNGSGWAVAMYGALRAGAILVNINPAASEREATYAIGHSAAKAVLAAPGFRGTNLVERARRIAEGCHTLEVVEDLDATWEHPSAVPGEPPTVTLQIDPDDCANIQYTSGSTGVPKGVRLSHHNLVNNANALAQTLDVGPGERICVPVPLFHCFGMVCGLILAAVSGAVAVLPGPWFDAVATLDAVEREGCSCVYGVPTMFGRMLAALEHRRWDLRSLRTGIMAGAPCPPDLVRQAVETLGVADLVVAFGMTETSPASCATPRRAPLSDRCSSVGPPLANVEVKVVDPDTGTLVERGRPGEVCVRGYNVMRGYWAEPERTARTIDDRGWLHTGDVGRMRRDGVLEIVGRLKDIIIRGGENIAPAEVEAVLLEHPAVRAVVVLGTPDVTLGEDLVAFVVGAADRDVAGPALQEHCSKRLASHKVPRVFRWLDALPETGSGKVQREALRPLAAIALAEHQTSGERSPR